MSNVGLLHSGFLDSVRLYPDNPAIAVSGEELTYVELYRKAAALAATIAGQRTADETPLTAIFANRSMTAFAGILGALMAGTGYVPLNCTFPVDRTKTMLRRSGCRTVIVDQQSESQLDQILTGLEPGLVLLLPEREDISKLQSDWPLHTFIGAHDISADDLWNAADSSPESAAYVLFTSGSTGVPKGVVVTHSNAAHYIEFIANRYAISQTDRFSQLFEMTFDLSVADMFVAWSRGACVCCPPTKHLINPRRFIDDSRLTVWFSVPSTPIFMNKLGSLKVGSFPGIRVSMFCGEALPVEVAKAWAAAAPNTVVDNLYGPTELTIACMYYRWDAERSPAEAELGVVPIGEPFPDMIPLVVDERLVEVQPGESGELLMAGPQVAAGYWQDTEKTARAFVTPPGLESLYYRTGDRVRRPAPGKPMTYLGRTDNQIQILGHRVELAEIEAVIREESGIEGVVALGWPITPGGAGGVEVFVQAEGDGLLDLKDRVAARLPSYMVPRRVHYLVRMPLNANGKFDRKALLKHLEELV